MPFSVPRALRTLAATVVLALAATAAPHGPLAAPPASAMPIEGYPTYQPQSRCSPREKLGTVMLSEHLLKRYPGSGSSGISRSCAASGVSEHKEGRAFDWRLSAASGRDRAYAQDFLERILATDRAGNTNALARRMGIMYVIWNDRIWSASAGYRERRYLHGACERRKGCSVTLRHRDHMHISLTWKAARGATSWYVKRGAPTPEAAPAPDRAKKPEPDRAPRPEPRPRPRPEPRPEPAADPAPDREPDRVAVPKRAPRRPDGVIDLRRAPYTRVRVPANGETVETRFKLRAGVTYSLTAAGLYSWGGPDQVADAVCTWSSKDLAWVPQPRRGVKRRYGRLALAVNGKRPFDPDCSGSHTYRTQITPTRDRTLKIKVLGRHPSSRGRLTVVVGRKRARVAPALPAYAPLTPAPTYSTNPRMGAGLAAETLTLRGTAAAVYTQGSLEPGATYRLTVAGVVGLARRVRSNGQCVFVRGTWYDEASIDPRVPGQDHGQLYVDGEPFQTLSPGCGSNEQVGEFVADTRGRLRLDLWDPLDRSDNTGALTVQVQRLTPIGTPVAADRERPRRRREEWRQRRDDLVVDSGRRGGATSTMRLRAGEQVRVVVSGQFRSGRSAADASCVRTSAGWLAADPDIAFGQDPLDLWVDGQRVSWRPLGGGRPCSDDARYATRFTATKNGPVRLGVFDLDHSDNDGTLQVILRRIKR